jgi:hypothetical protein
MHYSQIPPKPLVAGMSEKDYDVPKVFFFKRTDGLIIAVEENEAWGLYTRRPQILGKHKRTEFELIGTGDGNIYREALVKAREAGKIDVKEAQKILKEGQQAELDACIGRIIQPTNMDKLA